jgi:hypothetical protein
MATEESEKVTIDFSGNALADLREVAARRHMTEIEAIRHALGIYVEAVRQEDLGWNLVLHDRRSDRWVGLRTT